MKTNISKVKKLLQIITSLSSLIYFMIILLCLDPKGEHITEHSLLTKFCLNCYVLTLFILLFIISVSKKVLCDIIIKNLAVLTNDKGKIIIFFSIGILYLGFNNKHQIFFALYQFLCGLVLLSCEIYINHTKNKEKNNLNTLKKIEKTIINSNIDKKCQNKNYIIEDINKK